LVVRHMNPIVSELESLRRIYEVNAHASSSLDEAMERGWAKADSENRERVSIQATLAVQAGEKLTCLIHDLQRQTSMAVVEWVSLHIETCLTILREDMHSNHEMAGVRSICLSDLLQSVAKQLQPSRSIFSINNFYLADYYMVYESVAKRTYA
jgi:hypothetical protein